MGMFVIGRTIPLRVASAARAAPRSCARVLRRFEGVELLRIFWCYELTGNLVDARDGLQLLPRCGAEIMKPPRRGQHARLERSDGVIEGVGGASERTTHPVEVAQE